MEPRKATAHLKGDLGLDLYALAQARADEVIQQTEKRCAGCPGPDSPNGCASRPHGDLVVIGRTWPMCPRGMIRARAWRRLAQRYLDAQTSPLSGFPEEYKPWAVTALRELRLAVRREEGRQVRESGKASLPRYSGRRNKES